LQFDNITFAFPIGTNGAVLSVVVDEDHIYLSQLYAPRMIKLLISSGQTLMSFEGHTETVFVLLLHDIRLYSGSGDKTIIVWNKNDGTINRRYFGHRADVYTLIMINEILYSGDEKGFIVKWNMTASRLAKSFQYVHKGSIQCFTTDGQDLYSGSVDLSVIKWNMTAGTPHKVYADPPKKLMFLSSWKKFIIAAGENSQIMFWDFSANNLDPYTVLSEHTDAVNCLFVHEEFLFSGSTDNSIIQWNITSLLSMRTFLGKMKTLSSFTCRPQILRDYNSSRKIFSVFRSE
jgi:WD40 repeat protein